MDTKLIDGKLIARNISNEIAKEVIKTALPTEAWDCLIEFVLVLDSDIYFLYLYK